MEKERSNKSRLLMWITYGVIVTALVGTTTLSRYMTTVSGSGSVAVAGVTMDSSVATINIDLDGLSLGTSKSIEFNVVNFGDSGGASDVTQEYEIEVVTTGNLPIIYTLEKKTSTDPGDYALTSDSSSDFKWTGGELPHSTNTTHSYTLTATWDENDNDYSLMNEVDAVQIVVHSAQKD